MTQMEYADGIAESGERLLLCARSLVDQLQAKNYDQVGPLLDTLHGMREWTLFRELGKLTRDLHESLNFFRNELRITDLAVQEFPDAKARLNHVISLTEQAANQTLSAVEGALPIATDLAERCAAIAGRWKKFRTRELSIEEFRELSRTLDGFFSDAGRDAETLQQHLSEVLIAQGFQDLTGQIIRKVITLVQDVEQSLVDLIRISGDLFRAGADRSCQPEGASNTAGPQIPGVRHGEALQGQDEVDELLSKLGF